MEDVVLLLLLSCISARIDSCSSKGLKLLILNEDPIINRTVEAIITHFKHFNHTIGSNIHGTVKNIENGVQITAGSILFAKNGVLYIKTLEALPLKQTKALSSYLHENQVVEGHHLKLQSNCSIIAQYKNINISNYLQNKANPLTKLLRGFDVFCKIDKDIFQESENWIEKLSMPLVVSREFSDYLTKISELDEEVSISGPGKQLIKSFWLVQRRIHQVTIKNYITIINLAAAHAKLCKSRIANLCDSVIAIYLMEEHLCLSDQSILGFVVGKRNIDSYGKGFEEAIISLYQHIIRIVSTYSDMSTKTEE